MSSSPPSSPPPPELNSLEETEKQVWEVLRSIPGINVTYGSVRCIVYIVKNDKKESVDLAIGVAKGAVQTAALAVGIFAAPVTIPVASGVLTGIAAKSVSDTMEVIVFFVTNPELFGEAANSEAKESIFYDKIKKVAGIGAVYSALRAPIYLFKKNKQKSIESHVDFMTNSGEFALQVGIRSIPNIDDQIQKVLEKTTKYAIKFFAKKIMVQVSQQKLTLELGLKEIAKAEENLQTIMDLANDPSEQSELNVKMDNVEAHLTVDENPTQIADMNRVELDSESKKQTWSFIPPCFRKSKSALASKTGNVKANDNDDNSEQRYGLIEDNNMASDGHVLILTD